MFSKRTFLAGGLTLAFVTAGCGAAGATPSPTAAPTAIPTVAPTAEISAAPTTAPSPIATTSAEVVLSFDDISVEGLAGALIDGGWFGDRQDKTLDSGAKTILLQAQKSDVVVSIVHDGAGALQRVTVYDPNLFASEASQFDMGVVAGALLNETLGTEFVYWENDLAAAKAANESLLETRTFGPDTATLRFGADAEYPGDALIYFEPAE